VSTSFLFRALLDCLDAWATDGTPAPVSRVPSRGDATLCDAHAWATQFPANPGLVVPAGPSTLELVDFGPDLDHGDNYPEPRLAKGKTYSILVPAVDHDGLDVAGFRAPNVLAPLGTYTGWSMRKRELGNGAMMVGITGSYIPFPESPEERQATRDPRMSILERYGNARGYVKAIEQACEALIADRLMLEKDRDRLVAEARDWGDHAMTRC